MQSTKVKSGFTVEEINEDMFNDEVGKVVDEVILTVVYDDRPEKAQADQPPVSVVRSCEANPTYIVPITDHIYCFI